MLGFDIVAKSQSDGYTGKLRPLAVGSVKRSSTFPELPTIAESGFQVSVP